MTTGSQGAFISVAQQGQLGLPPTQPPVFWGAAGSTSGEGCLWVPTLPSPFCEGVTPVPAGKAPGACPLPAEAQSPRAPSSVHPYLLTRPPGTSLSSSHWICCFQFLEMVGGARTYECHYGEKTKPGILLPRGENRNERKAGFAECLKHK